MLDKLSRVITALCALAIAIAVIGAMAGLWPGFTRAYSSIVTTTGDAVATAIHGISTNRDGKNRPFALHSAMLLRIPQRALDESETSRAFASQLHQTLDLYGGWNRWQIDRHSDTMTDPAKTELHLMYFVALGDGQEELPSVIEKLLAKHKVKDALLLGIDLK